MEKDVIIDVGSDEIKLALLEDDQPVEVYFEKTDNKSLVGNIYRGKVKRILKGIQAAFVDIGLEKNAFLYVKDIAPVSAGGTGQAAGKTGDISRLLTPGQEITVQVMKDAVESKGARVTTRISLPGRYSALVFNSSITGVSHKIEDEEERARLKDIAQKYRPDNAGLIIRTAAEGMPEEVLAEDISELTELYHDIKQKEEKGNVPRLLYKEPGIVDHAVREFLKSDIRRFIINSPAEFERIQSYINERRPDLKNKIQLYSKEYDMFEYYHVKSAINEALSRKVYLKSGAYLIFDRTEALTVIDVNSGKYTGKINLEDTALKINLEAAHKIAHQIRLRNLSGIIIVDFIDMRLKEHQQRVVDTLRELVKTDKTHTVVVGMTGLGLVEMTRKKIRMPLYKNFTVDCKACNGTGYRLSPHMIVKDIRKRLETHFENSGPGCVEIYVNPEIQKFLLDNKRKTISELEDRYSSSIDVFSSYEVDYENVLIKRQEVEK
ncbi:MAG: Rne/Rng family ribonuclease [Clostridiaceae bacterium]|nr:Rne/Rng family ribonuclease [Clostridiaceae bacterium]